MMIQAAHSPRSCSQEAAAQHNPSCPCSGSHKVLLQPEVLGAVDWVPKPPAQYSQSCRHGVGEGLRGPHPGGQGVVLVTDGAGMK